MHRRLGTIVTLVAGMTAVASLAVAQMPARSPIAGVVELPPL